MVLAFGAFAVLTAAAVGAARARLGAALTLEVSPHEIAGAVLALLLVLRTNAGHDRWWEALFLATLPPALLGQLDRWWLVPLVTMAVAYPLLTLDRIGEELQNPFATDNVNHLPLDDLAAGVERNLRALLGAGRAGPAAVVSVPVLVPVPSMRTSTRP